MPKPKTKRFWVIRRSPVGVVAGTNASNPSAAWNRFAFIETDGPMSPSWRNFMRRLGFRAVRARLEVEND